MGGQNRLIRMSSVEILGMKNSVRRRESLEVIRLLMEINCGQVQ